MLDLDTNTFTPTTLTDLDQLCLDCVTDEEFDSPEWDDDLLDEDGNITDAGFSLLSTLDREGQFV